ncbi:MAG: glycosyltransferase [Limisphaerales bacterium]
MSEPLVSVVLPVYNAADTLRRAAGSILDGTWQNLELIVVNDGSTDRSADALPIDSRIRLITQSHAGVASAMNRGVAEAKGEFIARMDADDFSYPERLQKQIQLLQSEQLDIAGGLVRIVDGEGNSVPSMQRYERWVNSCITHEEILSQRFIESPLVHPTIIAKHEVWKLGCRKGDFPEDYDLWLRALQANYRAAKVPEVILDWTDGKSRLTRTDERYSMDAFDSCRREHLLLGPLHNQTHCGLWGAGETGKGWLRWLQSSGLTIPYVVDVAPKKIGKRIHNVEVISFKDLPESDGTTLLVAVGAEGAREKILPALQDRGYESGQNAWFVA